MTYGWARDTALSLVNQYTIAGASVSPGYNCQADALAKLPRLVDDGQNYIASAFRRIPASKPLSELEYEERGGVRVYMLPQDFYQLRGASLRRMAGGKITRFCGFCMLENAMAVTDEVPHDELELEYYRFPRPLGPHPIDSDLLDNSADAQLAVPYYAAAHLVMDSDAFVYTALMNEFEYRAARLSSQPGAEIGTVQDSYMTGGAWY